MIITGQDHQQQHRDEGGVTDQRRQAREAEEQAVGPLLARANLFRMRGQWDEAVAACTEALRRAPESATAHSLMGDIYEAQARWEDAMHWFGMAVDLDPGNTRDREKLDRVLGTQRAAAAAQLRGPASAAAAAGGHGSRISPPAHAGERTLEWFDRFFPPGRSETVARMIFALSGVIALVLVMAAAFVYFTYQRDTQQASLAGQQTGGGPGLLPAPPMSPGQPTTVRVAPPPTAAAPVIAGQQQRQQPATPTADTKPLAPTVTAPPTTTVGSSSSNGASAPSVNDTDAALLANVSRSLPAGLAVTAARVDPRTAQVLLEVALSAAPGETAAIARERVLRAAAFVAHRVAVTEPQARRISVRVSQRTETATRLAFVGDATAEALRASDPVTGTMDTLLPVFTNPWWSPALSPAPPGP